MVEKVNAVFPVMIRTRFEQFADLPRTKQKTNNLLCKVKKNRKRSKKSRKIIFSKQLLCAFMKRKYKKKFITKTKLVGKYQF